MATLQQPFEKKLDFLAIRAARVCVDSGLHRVEARVVAAFDMRDDMGPAYRSGAVHELATAALALALRFDDDGIVPVWTFHEDVSFAGDMRREDYGAFLMQRVLPPPPLAVPPKTTASCFAPLIDRIGESLFGAAWSPDTPRTIASIPVRSATLPALVLIFTGGDCADQAETEAILRYASQFPIFWQFVGVSEGPPDDRRFVSMRHMDVLVGGHVDACGFFAPEGPSVTEAVFAGLVSEFPGWLERPEIQAMLFPRAPSSPETGPGLDLGVAEEAEDAARAAERAERERRRAARARSTVESAEAWPKAGGAGNNVTAATASRRGQTRPLAPSYWRLEAVRERAWELPEESATALELAEAPPAAIRPSPSAPPDAVADDAAERLARIRRRREERGN